MKEYLVAKLATAKAQLEETKLAIRYFAEKRDRFKEQHKYELSDRCNAWQLQAIQDAKNVQALIDRLEQDIAACA